MQQGWDDARAYVERSRELRDTLGVPDGEELHLAPLAQGEHNSNFLLTWNGEPGKAILRLNFSSQMGLDDQVGYEFAALQGLAASGRTPAPLFVDGSRTVVGRGVLAMEFCEGRHLEYTRPGDVNAAASILADIHSVRPHADSPLVRPADPLAEQLRECVGLFAVYRSWAQADVRVVKTVDRLLKRAQDTLNAVSNATDREHILNTEAVSDHFLIPGDGAGARMVDWEKPIIGEVAQDVAYFLSPTTTIWKIDFIFSDEERARFVDAYWQAVDDRFPRRGFDERFAAYVQTNCLRGITWSAAATVEYRNPERALKNADTEARLGLYLAPGFLSSMEQRFFS